MIGFFIGLIGSIIALVGWFGFKSIILLVIGTILYLIETIIDWKQLNIGAKILDLVVFGIGCIIGAFIQSIPFYVGGLIAINIYSIILSIIAIPQIIDFIKYSKR